MEKVNYKGSYINGEFVSVKTNDESWSVISPGDYKDSIIDINATFEHIDAAVESAARGFKQWKRSSLEERVARLRRLQEIYLERKEEMAEVISRETGKPLWETMGEAGALAGKINITIEKSLELIKEKKVENALPGVDGFIRFKPRGVMLVVGPFNFPAHLPNGHIVPALLAGNSIVFKPSEKTPATAQLMAECIHAAGFPAGVFNMVQGAVEVSKRLTKHDGVDGVLFTGSYDVGLQIKEQTLNQYWKLLALEMGGKNSAIVWSDAEIEKAIYENLIGSFLSAGQRCSCTSKIVVHDSVYDEFVSRFHSAAKKIAVGHWKEKVFMGPVIDKRSLDNFVKFQEIGVREGNEALMRGKPLDVGFEGNYVSPSIHLVSSMDPKSIYQNTEIFSPNVAIYKTSDLEEAIDIVNVSGFGLVASIFSKSRENYEKVLMDAKVGLVNWNRTTNGASSQLPFGGMGKSGNDRPSAHFALNYCTVPVASLEDGTSFNSEKVMTGINW